MCIHCVTGAVEGLVVHIITFITDKVALIDFPNRASLWKCITSELELVERKVQTGSTVRGGTERREIGIPAELAAHMSQRVTEQVVGRHAEQ